MLRERGCYRQVMVTGSGTTILIGLAIGLVAGTVGGLAGIGGSIIMIPALALTLGYSSEQKTEHHLYMAVAMCVNVVVSLTSHWKHRRSGVNDPRLMKLLLPGMVGGIGFGVVMSDRLEGSTLKLALVVFLMIYCAYNAVTALLKVPEREQEGVEPAAPKVLSIGAGTGLLSGLLGIGGGIVMVPLMQIWARVPLKRAIAASASVMWVSASIGAFLKILGLDEHGYAWTDALKLAAPMAIGAAIGAPIGATLTHKLKLPHLKLAISVILAIAGARMVGWI